MNELELLRVAEQLVKNLQWLEVGNPLATIDQLLRFGIAYSDRIKWQYDTVKDRYLNEWRQVKTLGALLRVIQDEQLRVVCTICRPPYIELEDGEDNGTLRRVQSLSGAYSNDLSLTMSRGRSKKLGGGSRGKKNTA